MEDLVSRGHPEAAVLDGYPVAKVLNYAQAARANRRHLALDLAVGVSLGIRDALGQEGPLLKAWLAEDPAVPSEPAPSAPPLSPWLGGLPVVKIKRKRDA